MVMQLCEYIYDNWIVHFEWTEWFVDYTSVKLSHFLTDWLTWSDAYTLAAKKHGKVTIWLFASSSYQNSYGKEFSKSRRITQVLVKWSRSVVSDSLQPHGL